MSVLINWSGISGRGCQCCSGLCKTSVWLQVKSPLWLCECLCLLGASAQPGWTHGHGPAAAVRLQAWYRRNFPRSRSPALPAAFNKSKSASTFKLSQLILYLTSVLQIEIVERGKVPVLRLSRSYQAGSSSPWERSSCELWMRRVCSRPSESGSVPLPRSRTRPSDPFWQRPLSTASPSPPLSEYLEHRRTVTEPVTSSWGFGRKKSFAGVDFQCKESFLLNSRFVLLKGLALGWFTY